VSHNNFTGIQLLDYALTEIYKAFLIIGGRLILVECCKNPTLTKFYENYGFSFLQDSKSDKDKTLAQYYKLIE